MTDEEYRKKREQLEDVRNWPLTIVAIIMAGICAYVVYLFWLVGNDSNLLHMSLFVFMPGLLAVLFLFAAIVGSKRAVKDALFDLFDLLTIWSR